MEVSLRTVVKTILLVLFVLFLVGFVLSVVGFGVVFLYNQKYPSPSPLPSPSVSQTLFYQSQKEDYPKTFS